MGAVRLSVRFSYCSFRKFAPVKRISAQLMTIDSLFSLDFLLMTIQIDNASTVSSFARGNKFCKVNEEQ